MNPNVEIIKQLRTATGIGVMECRKALEHNGLNYDLALSYLQEKAAESLRMKVHLPAHEGKIELYAHHNGRIGVMVEINSETEFASRTERFNQFAHEIALQIASDAPIYVSDDMIPERVLDELRGEYAEKARLSGKSEKIIEQIADGALEKFKNKYVLVRQKFIRDENISVGQLIDQISLQLSERILVRRFVRWDIMPEAESGVQQA